MSGYTIIDVDTHVTETPDLWTSRAPASMRDRVPRVEKNDDGSLGWVIAGDSMLTNPGLTATAGVGTTADPPKSYEEMHPGAYDAKARLAYMDQLGIWAMVMYPNVGGFGAQQFLKMNDPELMLRCLQIYNDWQSEWAEADSRRLLPITSLPFWDVEASVAEVRRCAEMGHRGILFSGAPQTLGQPLLGDPQWNPIWETAVELNLPISFHIGSGDFGLEQLRPKAEAYGRMAAFTSLAVDVFLQNGMYLSDLIMSGVLIRYPDIKFVSVESGIGWIPFVLEALDFQFHNNRVREENPAFELNPSEYFARNIYACYWFEQVAPRRLIDKVGADNIMFETDFPHPTSLYGDEVHRAIEAGLADCEESVRRKILWENGRDLYKIEEPSADDEAKCLAT